MNTLLSQVAALRESFQLKAVTVTVEELKHASPALRELNARIRLGRTGGVSGKTQKKN